MQRTRHPLDPAGSAETVDLAAYALVGYLAKVQQPASSPVSEPVEVVGEAEVIDLDAFRSRRVA